MANGPDPYKTYNEQIKTFETLAKREAEILQKLAQADAERDAEVKVVWATELLAVIGASSRLNTKRRELVNQLGQ
jgi:hypothetical protein